MTHRRSLGAADIDELVTAYEAAARTHRQASANGEYKIANREHDKLAGIYRELRARGPGSQLALLKLLESADPNVRSWAAAHALDFSPAQGRLVLEALTRETGLVGFDAKMTLKEWEAGRLKFP